MRKRTWIMLGTGAVLLMVAIGAINNRGTASAQAALPGNQIAQVTRTTLSAAVGSSGSIAAENKAALTFGTSGTVAEVNVDVGGLVKKGDVLAKLDTAKLELQVAKAEQAYLLQQATYSKTVQVDPEAVTAAQAALHNAQNAYQIALRKSGLSGDQITVSCANLNEGNMRQLPGDFVIDKDGIIRLVYIGKNIGDNLPVDKLLSHINTMPAKVQAVARHQ